MQSYQKLIDSKRDWTPNFVSFESAKPGSENTILRALSLLDLEVSVMGWLESSKRESQLIGNEAVLALEDNAQDELKHDKGLRMACSAYGVTQELIDASQTIVKAWLDHPDHPIVKAAILESSVFFVILPMYRFLGGAALRTLSRDISGDEQVHVRVHLEVAKALNQKWSKSLDKLRADTIDFLVSDLKSSGQYGNPEFWRQSSYDLMHSGSANRLTETRNAVMPSFFETDAQALPSY